MIIKSNKHWNNFVYGYELTEKEKSDFDYIEDLDSHDFIRYRGGVIDPSELMRVPEVQLDNPLKAWQGYSSDSYFSGIVVNYSTDGEQYQIGTYIS